MEQKRQEDTTESNTTHMLQQCDAEEHKTNKKQTLRVLEFYSGIGGMRYSLLQSGVAATVVQAFDMNQVANRVYSHNFGEEPSSKAIEHLTVEELTRYEADLYLLSPPCQPYTRAGLQRGNQDNRTNSLLHLLSLLQMLPASSRPTYLLLENVKGFEQSDTCQVLTQVLDYCNYAHQHFLLTPTQFGVPNQRLRYYCLAKAMHKGSFYDGAGQLIENLAGLLPPQPGNDYRGHASTCLPLSSFLEKGSDDQPSSCFAVPPSFFRSVGYRHGWCYCFPLSTSWLFTAHSSRCLPTDIVSPESMTSSCFTKGYGQNFWAAGPLLLSSTSCEVGFAGTLWIHNFVRTKDDLPPSFR
ncbi:C-5 cytosine-specific DNA methylase, variant 4 [Balamuthia mandrillaris]